MFLSRNQLTEMTGYRNHSAQIRWLVDNGYSFDVRSDGRPNVLLDQVRERQCNSMERAPGPDLSWLE